MVFLSFLLSFFPSYLPSYPSLPFPSLPFLILCVYVFFYVSLILMQECGGVPEGLSCTTSQVRLILRDMTGKHVWDYTLLHGPLSWQHDCMVYPGIDVFVVVGIFLSIRLVYFVLFLLILQAACKM